MKKKIAGVVFTVLLAGMMLAGCKKNVGTPEDNAVTETEETEEEDTAGVFGYSCVDIGAPYFDTLEKVIETLLEEEGYQLLVKNPGADPELQNEQIQELIDAEVDAVFLCPVDWEAVTPALEALDEAGIPVINVDTRVKETGLVDAYVGSDNKNAGYVCGEDLVEQCPDGGKILIFECHEVNSMNERITGFEEAIAGSGFEVLDRVKVSGEKEEAQEKMTELLALYPHIDAVMCGDDQIALGVLAAAEAAGRSEMKIYGVDGSPDIKAEIAGGNSVIAGTGAQSPISVGKAAVETGIAIVQDEKYEEETVIETFFINKENVEMYGTDSWQ